MRQLLIIGIDSSYALGFMQTLVQMYLNPRAGFKGLVGMGRKLAQRRSPDRIDGRPRGVGEGWRCDGRELRRVGRS